MMKKLLILFVELHVYPPMWILTHTYKLHEAEGQGHLLGYYHTYLS